MTPEERDTEYLTDELKRLVGTGASLEWLPLMPTLRGLAQIDEEADMKVIGKTMLSFLVEGIESLHGSYEFRGKWYPATTMNTVYRVLLAIGQYSNTNAPGRRSRALMLLNLGKSTNTWRCDDRLERDFLEILASHIVNSASSSSEDVAA